MAEFKEKFIAFIDMQEVNQRRMLVVHQQIGTLRRPCMITYTVRTPRPLEDDNLLKRWSLSLYQKEIICPQTHRLVKVWRAAALPIAATDHRDKPTGTGTFGYTLHWERHEKGLLVARFFGENILEELIIPTHIVAARMAADTARKLCDEQANERLVRCGVKVSGARTTGLVALREYVEKNPTDVAAGNVYDSLAEEMLQARRVSEKARRLMQDIYRKASYRVCSRHAAVVHDEVDLAKIARNKTRNLLAKDETAADSRTLRQIAGVFFLRQCLKQHGLPATDVAPTMREQRTDVFSSYFESLAPIRDARAS